MNLVLREGISFCETSGRFIFLDLGRDRYFALAAERELSFRRLVARETLGANDEAALCGLVESGLLAAANGRGRIASCIAPHQPEQSLLEEDCRVRPAALVHALYRLSLSQLEMKVGSLAKALARLRIRKAQMQPSCSPDPAALLEIAAAFKRTTMMAAPLDQCVPRSIAIAHAMIDREIEPSLVIGVKLRPFGAHCWVQHGADLVNETLDNVRNFTPILVI